MAAPSKARSHSSTVLKRPELACVKYSLPTRRGGWSTHSGRCVTLASAVLVGDGSETFGGLVFVDDAAVCASVAAGALAGVSGSVLAGVSVTVLAGASGTLSSDACSC